ncbi:MAG TPA: Rrf2 family transcriptional regulator [Candidatus Limnocylindria bacterium]|nr:Rrf2 family transcriptional regulator [Candidatus Limnocylindria bacterium]
MKLSVRGEYALRALQVLAELRAEAVVPMQTIAERQNIPRRFLEQILHSLKTGGLVESRRGITGGYRLARPPEEIPLASIIRHVDGALAPLSCVSQKFYEKCSCPDEARCALRSVMKEVRDTVAGMMERLTLADLVSRAETLQAAPITDVDFVI